MRKFKVIKSWPGGPYVGDELHEDSKGNFGIGFGYSEKELKGFVEEIKEPEEFWFIELDGIARSQYYPTCPESIPEWLRFRTKESAEKFAKELKDSHGTQIDREKHDTQSIWNALNDRVK